MFPTVILLLVLLLPTAYVIGYRVGSKPLRDIIAEFETEDR